MIVPNKYEEWADEFITVVPPKQLAMILLMIKCLLDFGGLVPEIKTEHDALFIIRGLLLEYGWDVLKHDDRFDSRRHLCNIAIRKSGEMKQYWKNAQEKMTGVEPELHDREWHEDVS
jgi:hypothetical protein